MQSPLDMENNKAQELAEKLKELNLFFANMITKINDDIHLLEDTLQESRSILDKPAKTSGNAKPFLDRKLAGSLQYSLN